MLTWYYLLTYERIYDNQLATKRVGRNGLGTTGNGKQARYFCKLGKICLVGISFGNLWGGERRGHLSLRLNIPIPTVITVPTLACPASQ